MELEHAVSQRESALEFDTLFPQALVSPAPSAIEVVVTSADPRVSFFPIPT
jgi:hypothetical protein